MCRVNAANQAVREQYHILINVQNLECDCLIRGGGSAEDLARVLTMKN